MTTDERIDRLVERHEALAQSVELMSHTLEELGRKTDERMNKLLSIAEAHQRRLDTLERG